MKKKLVSLAIAAAIAAPMAAMADATIYGRAHVTLDYADLDRGVNWGGWLGPLGAWPWKNTAAFDGRGQKWWGLNSTSRNSRLGVKGSEDLGGGLKAIYKMEFGIAITNRNSNIADGEGGNAVKMRNSYVGLAGGWGTFLMGRHDTPAKMATGRLDMFGDTMADYNRTVGFADIRADSTVAYVSPNFAGFTISGAVIPSGGASPLGRRSDTIIGDEGEILGVISVDGDNADGLTDAWSLAANYSNGPFFAALSYEQLSKDHFAGYWDEVGLALGEIYDIDPRFLGGADDWNYWKVGLGLLDWHGFTLSGVYESHSNVVGSNIGNSDMKLWQVQAAYAFGNFKIKGMYGKADLDRATYIIGVNDLVDCAELGIIGGARREFCQDDKNTWAVGVDYDFSKRTRAYLLYTKVDDDRNAGIVLDDRILRESSDWNGFSIGLLHKF